MTPRGVLAFCREKDVKSVELRYTDLAGHWQQVTIPVKRLSEASFDQGIGLLGLRPHHGVLADHLFVPHAASAILDPFAPLPVLILFGSLQDPITREDDPWDSRALVERSLTYLRATGIADQARFATRCEFSLFERGKQAPPLHQASDYLALESRRDDDVDEEADLRNMAMVRLMEADVPASLHRRICNSRNSHVMELEAAPAVTAADHLMLLKYFVQRTAIEFSRSASFLPLPIVDLPGNGLQWQVSLWREETPLFAGQAFGGLSELGLYALGGILHHTAALTAFCNPTPNSHERLHHPNSIPWTIGYSQDLPQSTCRISKLNRSPRSKSITLCTPDPSVNPYLAIAAILMAAIDGIQNKIEPEAPLSQAGQTANPLPPSLADAMDELARDSDFLLRGDVFSPGLLQEWRQMHLEGDSLAD